MRNRGEFDLVYVERCFSRSEAMKREKEIKKYKGGGNAFRKMLSDFAEQNPTI